jgi:hypothetical protein
MYQKSEINKKVYYKMLSFYTSNKDLNVSIGSQVKKEREGEKKVGGVVVRDTTVWRGGVTET